MGNASRIKLHDVLGNECCHPTCYAPPTPHIHSPVPLCELHIYQVFKAVNRFVAVEKANTQPYTLLPVEADQIAGPCPACGATGYLSRTISDDITCSNDSCRYTAHAADFEQTRRRALFNLAGRQNVVYYISFRDLIKIGTTSNLQRRWVGIGYGESLLGFELGGRDREAVRHRQFQMYHSHREWFDNCPQIRAHINDVCATAA